MLLALSFVLIFLFSQTASLVHSHSGDLSKHLNCELCLKFGSNDNAIPVVIPALTLKTVGQQYAEFSQPTLVVHATTARSRSPPQTSLI